MKESYCTAIERCLSLQQTTYHDKKKKEEDKNHNFTRTSFKWIKNQYAFYINKKRFQIFFVFFSSLGEIEKSFSILDEWKFTFTVKVVIVPYKL